MGGVENGVVGLFETQGSVEEGVLYLCCVFRFVALCDICVR